MAIHSKDDAVIREFALKKPVFRIVANTQSSMGATGYTTGLAPSMSLGCGAYAGNITSDNITPFHLINVKRLAYEIRPARPAEADAKGPGKAAGAPLSSRVDAFLGARGFGPAAGPPSASQRGSPGGGLPSATAPAPLAAAPPPSVAPPVAFVCEDDVRAAAKAGRRIVLGPKTIVTPAARDAGEALRIFDTA
jgi:acetaldehyde dehydrogenase (acetylating)